MTLNGIVASPLVLLSCHAPRVLQSRNWQVAKGENYRQLSGGRYGKKLAPNSNHSGSKLQLMATLEAWTLTHACRVPSRTFIIFPFSTHRH